MTTLVQIENRSVGAAGPLSVAGCNGSANFGGCTITNTGGSDSVNPERAINFCSQHDQCRIVACWRHVKATDNKDTSCYLYSKPSNAPILVGHSDVMDVYIAEGEVINDSGNQVTVKKPAPPPPATTQDPVPPPQDPSSTQDQQQQPTDSTTPIDTTTTISDSTVTSVSFTSISTALSPKPSTASGRQLPTFTPLAAPPTPTSSDTPQPFTQTTAFYAAITIPIILLILASIATVIFLRHYRKNKDTSKAFEQSIASHPNWRSNASSPGGSASQPSFLVHQQQPSYTSHPSPQPLLKDSNHWDSPSSIHHPHQPYTPPQTNIPLGPIPSSSPTKIPHQPLLPPTRIASTLVPALPQYEEVEVKPNSFVLPEKSSRFGPDVPSAGGFSVPNDSNGYYAAALQAGPAYGHGGEVNVIDGTEGSGGYVKGSGSGSGSGERAIVKTQLTGSNKNSITSTLRTRAWVTPQHKTSPSPFSTALPYPTPSPPPNMSTSTDLTGLVKLPSKHAIDGTSGFGGTLWNQTGCDGAATLGGCVIVPKPNIPNPDRAIRFCNDHAECGFVAW
ncbi:hypothetical protein HDU97_010296 [Phlyctochytrium planicorne]|nr:hypothetical protein HDU97_010296 [Phlyctochytrium planicorne]